jgi:phosphoglycolate phosphatase-like HAD superfamily hydrolase
MQFGSETVITSEVQLILMDCFETLIQFGAEGYTPRKGIVRFLETIAAERRIPVVVISDAPEAAIAGALRQAGLLPRIASVYDRRACEDLGEGRMRKRLDLPLTTFGIAPHRAVFIGDSPLDAQAAQHHGVPFIRVPRSEDRGFSFEQLLSGPSSYQSAEFSAHFVRELRRKP